jgi:hypothetical protein
MHSMPAEVPKLQSRRMGLLVIGVVRRACSMLTYDVHMSPLLQPVLTYQHLLIHIDTTCQYGRQNTARTTSHGDNDLLNPTTDL